MTTDIQTAALLANFSEFVYHPNDLPPAEWEQVDYSVEGSFAAYAYKNTINNRGQLSLSPVRNNRAACGYV